MTTLTYAEAVRQCKALWEEIRESGMDKLFFIGSPDGKKWLDLNCDNACPLCEYALQAAQAGEDYSIGSCSYCPLKIQYGKDCYQLGFSEAYACTPRWFEAIENLKEAYNAEA